MRAYATFVRFLLFISALTGFVMRIACLIHSLNGGGAERVMAGLASHLAKRDHEVTLVTLDDAKQDRHEVDDAVRRIPLNVMSDGKPHGVSLFRKLTRIFDIRHRVHAIHDALLEIQPDVVLSFCDRTNVLAGLAVRKMQSSKALPLVVCERSDPAMQTLPLGWRLLRRWSYPNASCIATQTASAASYFSAGGPASFGVPVAVIGSAVNEPPVTRNATVATRHKIILGVGRLSHEKGFDRLIEAFAFVANKHPDWRLRILGEGHERDSLTEQVKRHQLTERVEFPGWIRSIGDELGSATMFVLPSRYEGFPSALLEAMATGVPSIALDCQVGSKEIIENAANGLIVGHSPREIADAILTLVEDEDMRERLGVAGRDVVDRFSWKAMTDQFDALLKEYSI